MAENKEHDDTSSEQRSLPHEAIFFVLNYLPLFELLSMIQVCKSLRDAINNDILPWMNIVVDRVPLNSHLSDDILMKLVSNAKGRLQVLALMNCGKITDDGLLRVIAQNPHISKLHVPSCTSLSPEGVIRAVQLLTKTNYNLKSLKINGIYGIKKEDLKTIQGLINLNHTLQQQQGKIFYHKYKIFCTLVQEENCRPVVVDICPRCDEVRMVFDCPRVSARGSKSMNAGDVIFVFKGVKNAECARLLIKNWKMQRVLTHCVWSAGFGFQSAIFAISHTVTNMLIYRSGFQALQGLSAMLAIQNSICNV